MEWDSFVQLLEARTQSYSNWHPPVMSWLLGISDMLPGPPACWFNAFTMVLVFAGLIGVVWARQKVSRAAVVVAALMLLLPQFFLHQGVVWKDTLFANVVLCGFAALALSARYWERTTLRYGLFLVAALLLALALLTRQNGIVVVPFAGLSVAVIAARRFGNGGLGAGLGAGFFALTGLIAFLGNAALQLRADDYPARQEQFKYLQLYDITGMVNRDLDLPLPILEREAPRLEHIIRTEAVARWSPQKVDTLIASPRILAELEDTDASLVARQWRQLVMNYPVDYIGLRALLFRWIFQAPNVGLCHPTHVGDEGDPADLKALGISERMDRRDVVLLQIGNALEKTPVFSHGLFAVISIVVLVLLLRRRSDSDLMMAGLILSTFAFAATFFVISIACDYRYLYLMDLSAVAGLLYTAGDWRTIWQR